MDISTLAGISVGLAMDAFAVSVGLGLCGRERVFPRTVRIALHFGLFQAGMTLLGYLTGWAASDWLQTVSHWVAAGLLWLVGVHMLLEAVRGRPVTCDPECSCAGAGAPAPDASGPDPARGVTLLLLSVATSIDAFGVGMSLALLGVSVWLPASVIGLVAAVISAIGVVMACHLAASSSRTTSRRAEALGGLVLIGIGIKIALQAVT